MKHAEGFDPVKRQLKVKTGIRAPMSIEQIKGMRLVNLEGTYDIPAGVELAPIRCTFPVPCGVCWYCKQAEAFDKFESAVNSETERYLKARK